MYMLTSRTYSVVVVVIVVVIVSGGGLVQDGLDLNII